VVLALVCGAGLFLLKGYFVKNATLYFTSEQPVPVQQPEQARVEIGAQSQELARLRALLADPQGSGEVTLTQNELDAVVAESHLRGKVFMQLVDDGVSAQFSLQLKDLGSWEAARGMIGSYLDRYISGSAAAKISVEEGVYGVDVTSLALNGGPLEDSVLTEASRWISGALNNLKVSDGPAGATKARIKKLLVKGGAMTISVGPA
jgi:hypothetical protein